MLNGCSYPEDNTIAISPNHYRRRIKLYTIILCVIVVLSGAALYFTYATNSNTWGLLTGIMIGAFISTLAAINTNYRSYIDCRVDEQ